MYRFVIVNYKYYYIIINLILNDWKKEFLLKNKKFGKNMLLKQMLKYLCHRKRKWWMVEIKELWWKWDRKKNKEKRCIKIILYNML